MKVSIIKKHLYSRLVFAIMIEEGYRKGNLVCRGNTDIPVYDRDMQRLETWAINTGYELAIS